MAKDKLAIALGGGAARGWAHIGVLRALAEAGLMPGVVVGTSIGAIVGGHFAGGRLEHVEPVIGPGRHEAAVDQVGEAR